MGKMKLRRRILQRLLSLRTHKLYAVADYLREYYIRVVGISARRIDTIYNGVDVEVYAPWNRDVRREEKVKLGFPAGKILIGAVGTLYWVKDPETFLKAASLVLRKRDDVSFLWIGEGPLKSTLQELARELGVEGKVVFLGSRDDVSSILATLDVFVLPSLIEGLSYSILEAMATGLPVVATDVGGNSELIRDGETGYLIPTKKPEILADILLRLVSEETLRADLGRRARQRIEEKFSLKKMVQIYEQMYLTGLFGQQSVPGDLPSVADHGVR
jgi:glycosyltransferase involved in cell wall biosynthesis